MGLQKYIKKRDFTQTSEPKAGKSTGKQLRFVVQRHHASHLHYDFRLEMEGVLKSWAVPKGPSLNPKDKRLAMMVEDHPYDYRTFEGTIPEGNYGGGVVHIFDEGTYEALENGSEKDLLQGLHAGNLKFKLKGKILKGEFALVKLKGTDAGNPWLLIKHNDRYAVTDKFNSEDLVTKKIKQQGIAFKEEAKKKAETVAVIEAETEIAPKEKHVVYQPMLAKLAEAVFDDPDWIYEMKFDGYRSLAFTHKKKKTKLVSRNGIDFTAAYAPLAVVLDGLGLEAVIDGEIVALDNAGKSNFQILQNYSRGGKIKPVLCYYVFDLLALNGHDLRELPLVKRKELLKVIVQQLDNGLIIYSEHVSETGGKLLQKARKQGWEGIIGKRADSTYSSNKRSPNWLKFKINSGQEAIIIGYTPPAGSRKYFGALVLAMYDEGTLVYTGNCGTGFTDATLKLLFTQMEELKTGKKPVHEKVEKEKDITWLKPKLVCDVVFTEWTAEGHLRHPVFKGLRTDKTAVEVTKIPAEKMEKIKESKIASSKSTRTTKEQGEEARTEKFGSKTVKLTNLNKVYWPKEGITKGEMLDYYGEVAAYMLPYLKDKPLSLNRHPNGITGPSFFQKDLNTDQIPKWIKYAPLYSESNDKNIDYLICNDKATLLWMANLGCIEINPWLSTYKRPEFPLCAVLDLDPHDLEFIEVIKVAQTAKRILDQMKIKAYIKTSGSKGLHIFIPTGQQYDYDVTKQFINYLGQLILAAHPETTSLERTPSKRKNKIYLDFLQNRRGQTIAAPYSLRPKPGATVSTPLKWEEVNKKLELKNYTIFNTLARIKKVGDLWQPILKEKVNLKKALSQLKIS